VRVPQLRDFRLSFIKMPLYGLVARFYSPRPVERQVDNALRIGTPLGDPPSPTPSHTHTHIDQTRCSFGGSLALHLQCREGGSWGLPSFNDFVSVTSNLMKFVLLFGRPGWPAPFCQVWCITFSKKGILMTGRSRKDSSPLSSVSVVGLGSVWRGFYMYVCSSFSSPVYNILFGF